MLLPFQAGQKEPVPGEFRRARASVWVFVTVDCSIANRYAPEIARLVRAFTVKGVAFTLVYVDPETSEREARDHARRFGYGCPVTTDPRQERVRKAGATVTPEVAVFTSEGKLHYRGRIDDRYPRLGVRRETVTRRDLEDALNAVLAGRPVPTPRTQAVGCFIPPLERRNAR